MPFCQKSGIFLNSTAHWQRVSEQRKLLYHYNKRAQEFNRLLIEFCKASLISQCIDHNLWRFAPHQTVARDGYHPSRLAVSIVAKNIQVHIVRVLQDSFADTRNRAAYSAPQCEDRNISVRNLTQNDSDWKTQKQRKRNNRPTESPQPKATQKSVQNKTGESTQACQLRSNNAHRPSAPAVNCLQPSTSKETSSSQRMLRSQSKYTTNKEKRN